MGSLEIDMFHGFAYILIQVGMSYGLRGRLKELFISDVVLVKYLGPNISG